jgi:hypothetical protein
MEGGVHDQSAGTVGVQEDDSFSGGGGEFVPDEGALQLEAAIIDDCEIVAVV